jgi:integrase/recombinase XerD
MTNRRQISIIGQYLHFYGNNIVEKMMIPWPTNTRPSVKWLTDEEGVRLIDAAKDPLEKMLIHLELRMLLRRCEVIRLTRHDIPFGILNVLGKGRMGGKWRTLAWAPETLEVIQEYSEYREQLIAAALEIKPDQKVPDNIMIYAQYGWKLGAYKETAIDYHIKEIAIRAGIPPEDDSNHVNRRTGTRIHRHAGVELEELSAALGHNSPQQTIQYAGLNVDDLAKQQYLVTGYLDGLRKEMAQRPYNAQPICRPQLIMR